MASKYIGETEKKLTAVFRNAARSGALLFFDEADALFGKRTCVRNAPNRYANLDASYLLQQLERSRGASILAETSSCHARARNHGLDGRTRSGYW